MQAIQLIYQQHAPAVYRFALGLCGDAHLARDLVADTFMRTMLSSTPIGMETVRGYLCTIARRSPPPSPVWRSFRGPRCGSWCGAPTHGRSD